MLLADLLFLYDIRLDDLLREGIFVKSSFTNLDRFFNIIVGTSSSRGKKKDSSAKVEGPAPGQDDTAIRRARAEGLEENMAYYYIVTHPKRVAAYTAALMKYYSVPDNYRYVTLVAALLHDIEKTSWNNLLLYEKSFAEFTDEDRKRIFDHPMNSATLIKELTKDKTAKKPGASEEIIRIIEQHHENIDGSGYPLRLKNGQICLGAKILRVTDSYDAMTGDRYYRRGKNFTHPEAIQDLCAKSHIYDLDIIAALGEIPEEERERISTSL